MTGSAALIHLPTSVEDVDWALPAETYALRREPSVFDRADTYMSEREGRYEWRATRFRAAMEVMLELGLSHNHTVYDVGAGWTEMDAVLRTEAGWRGRYIPTDFGIDGIDIDSWSPPRHVDFACALELIEHLHDPWRLVDAMKKVSPVVILSVPSPETTDVLGMDDDHRSIITREALVERGFTVSDRMFYGGFYSDGKPDGFIAWWTRHPDTLTYTVQSKPEYRRAR